MIVLDLASVNMALPGIARALALSDSQVSWVFTTYTLTFGCLLLLGARLGTVLGPRRILVVGLLVFGTASLAGGLAPSAGWLVAARAVQGVGAALVSPSALASLCRLFPDGRERNRALAIWGAWGSAGAPAGALVGGALSDALGWSAVLLFNVPLSAAAVVVGVRVLPAFEPSASRRSFDVTGTVTVTTGLALLVYACVNANRSGWASAETLVPLALAAGLIAAFVAVEQRTRDPLLPSGIFSSSSLTPASVLAAIAAMPVYGMAFGFSLYTQGVLEYGSSRAGLALLPFGVFGMVTARGASVLVTRLGFKAVTVLGLCVMAAGLVPLATVGIFAESFLRLMAAAALVGSGAGLVVVSTNVAALSGASDRDAVIVAGVVTTSQQIGGALGVALTVAVLDGVARVSGDVPGVRAGFAFNLVLAVMGAMLALLLMSSRASRAHARAARRETAPSVVEA